MITIREYRNEDLESVRDVCHKTAHTKTYQKNKDLVTTMYLDYYAIEEPEHVFVAVDETDTPIGYILCSIDYDKFHKVFIEKYASKIKKRFPIGCTVRHRKFGDGVVKDISDGIISIKFMNESEKELGADFCIKNKLLEKI